MDYFELAKEVTESSSKSMKEGIRLGQIELLRMLIVSLQETLSKLLKGETEGK